MVSKSTEALVPAITREFLANMPAEDVQKLAVELEVSLRAGVDSCISRIVGQNRQTKDLKTWTSARLRNYLVQCILELDKTQLLQIASLQKAKLLDICRQEDRQRLEEYLAKASGSKNGPLDVSNDEFDTSDFCEPMTATGPESMIEDGVKKIVALHGAEWCSFSAIDGDDKMDVVATMGDPISGIAVCQDDAGIPFDRSFTRGEGKYLQAVRILLLRNSEHAKTSYSTQHVRWLPALRAQSPTERTHKSLELALQHFYDLDAELEGGGFKRASLSPAKTEGFDGSVIEVIPAFVQVGGVPGN